ncbi:MAG: hypothetical protein ACRECH_01340 [Nitrososphaerales archaeon]
MFLAPWLAALGFCFGLGMIHGVVPDEHTWPITFSYAVGSTSGRGGLMSGVYFALAFTLQRAIMSQLVYFALVSYLAFSQGLDGPVYVAVGVAMAAAGYLILYDRLPHWHPLMWISRKDKERHEHEVIPTKRVPIHWCLIHGFIAGFGVDAGLFTTYIYLVAVPLMPSSLIGFAPGAAFGLGTLAVLALIGTVFGSGLRVASRWGAERVEVFGTRVGARSLLFGGITFAVAGVAYLSGAANSISVDIGNLLILLFLIAVIIPVMIWTWREVKNMPVGRTVAENAK